MGDLLFRTIGATVRIETILEKSLWPATADPSQIESVILNLAVNARDAMTERWATDDRDCQCTAWRQNQACRIAVWRLCKRLCQGYRDRDDGRGAGESIRAILYNKAGR